MIRRFLMNASMVLMFAIAALMLVPALLGYHRYVIQTGSMTGTYDPGSIVFDKPVPTSTLKVGDPITYAPPPGASPNHKLVTHRIYKVFTGPSGQRAYITKGDANPAPDVWKFTLKQPTQDKVVFSIPYAGYIFEFLSVPQFRLALIGLPALLMALWMIAGMWRDGGEEIKRRREGLTPWGADVARKLPALKPLAEAAAVAVRSTVQLPMTWPKPRAHAPRVEAGFVSPLVSQKHRSDEAGTVALPETCVARERRVTKRRRDHLPGSWHLVVDPRL